MCYFQGLYFCGVGRSKEKLFYTSCPNSKSFYFILRRKKAPFKQIIPFFFFCESVSICHREEATLFSLAGFDPFTPQQFLLFHSPSPLTYLPVVSNVSMRTHTQNLCVRLNTKAAIKQGVLGTSRFVVLLNEFCDFQ